MDTWMRFMSSDGGIVFGRVEGGYLHEYERLDQPVPTGAVLSTRALTPLAPCAPGKIVARAVAVAETEAGSIAAASAV